MRGCLLFILIIISPMTFAKEILFHHQIVCPINKSENNVPLMISITKHSPCIISIEPSEKFTMKPGTTQNCTYHVLDSKSCRKDISWLGFSATVEYFHKADQRRKSLGSTNVYIHDDLRKGHWQMSCYDAGQGKSHYFKTAACKKKIR